MLVLKILFLLKIKLNERVFRSTVDGGWSNWGSYEPCSTTCGLGSQTRQRTCNKPPPSAGGKQCDGSGSETKSCNVKACPGIYAYFKVLIKGFDYDIFDIKVFYVYSTDLGVFPNFVN